MSAAHKTARAYAIMRGFTNSPWTGQTSVPNHILQAKARRHRDVVGPRCASMPLKAGCLRLERSQHVASGRGETGISDDLNAVAKHFRTLSDCYARIQHIS